MGATPDGDIATASMAVIRYADPLCRLKLEEPQVQAIVFASAAKRGLRYGEVLKYVCLAGWSCRSPQPAGMMR
jgi:hypothetical protein